MLCAIWYLLSATGCAVDDFVSGLGFVMCSQVQASLAGSDGGPKFVQTDGDKDASFAVGKPWCCLSCDDRLQPLARVFPS